MDSAQLDLFAASEPRNGWADAAERAFDRSFKRYRQVEDAALVIQQRVELDQLPAMSAPRIYGAPGIGGYCDACDQELLATQLVMSVPWPRRKTFAHLHADCFMLWNAVIRNGALKRTA